MKSLQQAVADYLNAVDAFRQFENNFPNDSTKAWDKLLYAKEYTEDALRAAYAADPLPPVVEEAPAPKTPKGKKEEAPFVLEYDKSGWVSTKECARLMRRILKETFPTVKFSVRGHSYAGGSHVDVNWTDGPTQKQVDAVIDGISGKTFDGMDDSWNYHDYLWQGDRIHFAGSGPGTSRSTSDEVYAKYGMDTLSYDDKEAVYRKVRATSYVETQPSVTLAMFRLYQPAKAAGPS